MYYVVGGGVVVVGNGNGDIGVFGLLGVDFEEMGFFVVVEGGCFDVGVVVGCGYC